jgi:hypothetical protein
MGVAEYLSDRSIYAVRWFENATFGMVRILRAMKDVFLH